MPPLPPPSPVAVKAHETTSVVEHIIQGNLNSCFWGHSHSYWDQNELLLLPCGVRAVYYINTTGVEKELPDVRKAGKLASEVRTN